MIIWYVHVLVCICGHLQSSVKQTLHSPANKLSKWNLENKHSCLQKHDTQWVFGSLLHSKWSCSSSKCWKSELEFSSSTSIMKSQLHTEQSIEDVFNQAGKNWTACCINKVIKDDMREWRIGNHCSVSISSAALKGRS